MCLDRRIDWPQSLSHAHTHSGCNARPAVLRIWWREKSGRTSAGSLACTRRAYVGHLPYGTYFCLLLHALVQGNYHIIYCNSVPLRDRAFVFSCSLMDRRHTHNPSCMGATQPSILRTRKYSTSAQALTHVCSVHVLDKCWPIWITLSVHNSAAYIISAHIYVYFRLFLQGSKWWSSACFIDISDQWPYENIQKLNVLPLLPFLFLSFFFGVSFLS
jgi:hypothetical protein